MHASDDGRTGQIESPAAWAMERANERPVSLFNGRPTAMNADAVHAALGLTFTFVWLMVGQILVGNR